MNKKSGKKKSLRQSSPATSENDPLPFPEWLECSKYLKSLFEKVPGQKKCFCLECPRDKPLGYDYIESHLISQRHLANVKSASLFNSYIKEKYFVVEASKSVAEPEKTIHKANKDSSNSNYSHQEESEHHYRLLVAKFIIQHDLPFYLR